MLEAIKHFDPGKRTNTGTPIRFLSFAVWYIRRNICMYILNSGLVRKTNNTKLTLRANKLRDEFIVKYERIPTVEELAEALYREYGIKVKDLSYLYDIDAKKLSANIYDDKDGQTVEDSAAFTSRSASQNEYLSNEDKEYNRALIEKSLKRVSERDAQIMRLLYNIGTGREHSMDEVAEITGLTRERVRQIKARALRRMKKTVSECPQL